MALEVASIDIAGSTIFLGDCENRLVLVKLYDPAALPDTALIGHLSHDGRVLSFCRDKIALNIDYGVRTARMNLSQHITSTINLAGEFIPKTCRNCGSEDHLVKDSSSIRCFNCERLGHHAENCGEPTRCAVCRADGHQLAECLFGLYSANIDSGTQGDGEQTEEERQRERERERNIKLNWSKRDKNNWSQKHNKPVCQWKLQNCTIRCKRKTKERTKAKKTIKPMTKLRGVTIKNGVMTNIDHIWK